MRSAGPRLLTLGVSLGALLALAPSCSSKNASTPCTPGGDGSYVNAAYDDLARYCMVSIENGKVVPSSEAVVYELNTPLFSDYATKVRTVWLPKGTSATYASDGVFDFPVGAIITKSFGFPKDARDPASPVTWVETRVMLRAADGWKAVSYQWDDAQSSAKQKPGGTVVPIDFIDARGTAAHASYLLPSINQCPKCHDNGGALMPIGPRAAQLNRDDQLARWSATGLVTGAPPSDKVPRLPVWDDPASGAPSDRARAYLDGNCAYCHSAGGEARTTGLFLSMAETDPTHLGVCKPPVAAGRATSNLLYDIVPGKPDESIVVYRMQATEPSVAMPELGRSIVHTEAVALVRQWIEGLAGSCPP